MSHTSCCPHSRCPDRAPQSALCRVSGPKDEAAVPQGPCLWDDLSCLFSPLKLPFSSTCIYFKDILRNSHFSMILKYLRVEI